jgi:anti-anti-sigma factor
MTADPLTAVRQRDGVAVIDLIGDVNARAEDSLETAWAQATAGHPDAVALNFAGTGYINSTGIALIVGLLAKARARGMPIRAFGLSPHYREIFEITRLADFLAISPDEDTAVHGNRGNHDG